MASRKDIILIQAKQIKLIRQKKLCVEYTVDQLQYPEISFSITGDKQLKPASKGFRELPSE